MNTALGLAIIGLIWRFVTDYPLEHKEHHIEQRHQLQTLGFWKSLGLAVKNRQNWLCGLYTSL
ncbi:MAG: MFS transporter, partial [Pseudomonadota bacterium]